MHKAADSSVIRELRSIKSKLEAIEAGVEAGVVITDAAVSLDAALSPDAAAAAVETNATIQIAYYYTSA